MNGAPEVWVGFLLWASHPITPLESVIQTLPGDDRMPLYICRWQNGDFSAVFARNREIADFMLDEVGNADLGEVFTAPNFMVHFKLLPKPDGIDDFHPFELEALGEAFGDQILEKCYPHFEKVAMRDDVSMEDLEDALKYEKARLWGSKEVPPSEDPEVRRLQELDRSFPVSVLESVVREGKKVKAQKLLDDIDPDSTPQ
jgi:hypothetical protein